MTANADCELFALADLVRTKLPGHRVLICPNGRLEVVNPDGNVTASRRASQLLRFLNDLPEPTA